MITKRYLEEYEKNLKNYNYEINKINKDIKQESMNTTIDSVVGSSKSYPYIQGHKIIEGINDSRIKKLEKRKKFFKSKKEKAEKELKYQIDILEDRVIADIIEKRYIKGMNFKRISIVLNYADESGARKSFDRFFKNN